jgi:hypothetical protein
MKRYKVVDLSDVAQQQLDLKQQAQNIEDFLNRHAEEGWVYRDALLVNEFHAVCILEKSTFTRIVEKSRQI